MLGVSPVRSEAGVILVTGDSISAAYGLDISTGWVSLLQSKIESAGHRVVNISISGETTVGGLNRLPSALSEHNPDVVIIGLGGNDGLRGLSPDQMQNNLEAMASMSRESGANVIIAGVRMPSNYGPAFNQMFVDAFSQAAENSDASLVVNMLDGIDEDRSLMQPDGIHPSREAQPLILENFWPVLEPLLDP